MDMSKDSLLVEQNLESASKPIDNLFRRNTQDDSLSSSKSGKKQTPPGKEIRTTDLHSIEAARHAWQHKEQVSEHLKSKQNSDYLSPLRKAKEQEENAISLSRMRRRSRIPV